jgi:hypothetical protein
MVDLFCSYNDIVKILDDDDDISFCFLFKKNYFNRLLNTTFI